jgi:hypothetical protein
MGNEMRQGHGRSSGWVVGVMLLLPVAVLAAPLVPLSDQEIGIGIGMGIGIGIRGERRGVSAPGVRIGLQI